MRLGAARGYVRGHADALAGVYNPPDILREIAPPPVLSLTKIPSLPPPEPVYGLPAIEPPRRKKYDYFRQSSVVCPTPFGDDTDPNWPFF